MDKKEVLILVVMDDALVPTIYVTIREFSCSVLILVVMDDALVHAQKHGVRI